MAAAGKSADPAATRRNRAPHAGCARAPGWLALALLLPQPCLPARAGAGQSLPAFAVRLADGRFRHYRLAAAGPGRGQVSDHLLQATLRRLEQDQWELELTSRRIGLSAVWFPWEAGPTAMGGDLSDDVIYYPRLLGVAAKASAADQDWVGQPYPGVFAPLVVQADRTEARIVAAVNWPPRIVTPLFARGRLGLRYDERLRPGTARRYRALLAAARGDERRGQYAWQAVLERYRSWLIGQMRRAGLYPPAYPPAMLAAHGWMHVGLHKLARFDVNELRRLYQRRRAWLGWIQFWGQMSNYDRQPLEGRAASAVPPLRRGEPTGCCLPTPRLHARYLPDLPAFAREVAAAGGLVGYYQRPRRPYGRLDLPAAGELAFLTGWIAHSRRAGANAFYLDVLGTRPFGDPLSVARLFGETFPAMSVIEWPVDIYPTAFLVGGALWGNRAWDTRPGQSPADFARGLKRVTFPRFGRYLLDDRVMFLGVSNGDFMWWGDYRGHQHWTERQAFLLGAKLDAPTRFKGQRGWVDPVNPVVERIIAEWQRVGWWERRPAYRDRAGLYDLPPGIDARRFVDRQGRSLLVVDNWERQEGKSLGYRGRRVALPPRQLCILALPDEAGRQ